MVLMQEKDFETADGPRAPMDVATFYDSLETKRMARLDGLVQQYNSIESLLIKVGWGRLFRSFAFARSLVRSFARRGQACFMRWMAWPYLGDEQCVIVSLQ